MPETIHSIKSNSIQIKGFLRLFVYFSLCLFVACSSDVQKKDDQTDRPISSETKKDSKNVAKKKKIVFFGNSLTAGYGLEEDEAFTTHIQGYIDSLELPYTVVNAGLSGETTAGGDRRIEWVLNQQMDLFFLELGGNDMLRGTEVEATAANLESIIQKVRAKHPDIPIILAGMQAPPNMGEAYTKAFAQIYPDLAVKYDLHLIPFFLEDVAGISELNLPDGIHPNAEGQVIVSKTVWEVLYPLIRS